VFPVAGLGTRFLPATKAMPKEMLTVVDKPLIQYAVEEALEAGIEQIIFVTGRGKGALEDHVANGRHLARKILGSEVHASVEHFAGRIAVRIRMWVIPTASPPTVS
jgi:UTP-glucose-1-phosphate uridylyltransferase